MLTKLLNRLGILTTTQRRKQRAQAEAFQRRARAKAAKYQAQSVITSPQVPKKNQKPKPPIKPNVVVRRDSSTDWEVIGYTDDGTNFTFSETPDAADCNSMTPVDCACGVPGCRYRVG